MSSGYIDLPVAASTGVTTLNGLSGALTLAAGTGIGIASSGGNTLTLSVTQIAESQVTGLTADLARISNAQALFNYYNFF